MKTCTIENNTITLNDSVLFSDKSTSFVDFSKKALKAKDITLIGGNAEEAPMAYKNIETVMASQTDLVDIIGSFQPRIVRMGK